MKISLSILLLAISTLLLSQNDTTYNYNYPYDWPYDCNTMLYLDSCYYLAGDVGRIKDGCANVVYGFHISKIDSTGIKDTTVVFDNCEETNYIGWKGSLKNKNGNLYILGQKYPSIGNNKLFISKINPVYDTISITNFMDDTITKRAFSFVFDDSENMIFAGTIDSSYNEMSGLPETTYTKSLLFKASLSGEIIWQRSYSFGDISDGCWSSITRVLPAYDKGYIAIGRTSDLGNSRNLILKTDSLGNQQWVKFFGSSIYDNPTFQDIIETKDSCYIVCGAYAYGETFGGLYPYDGWLIKFDDEGNTKWNKKYRDYVINNTDWRDTIRCNFVSISELSDSGLVTIAAVKSSECGGKEFRIYRFNKSGDVLWTKLFTEFPDCNNTFNCNTILETNDGGFVIGGDVDYYVWDTLNEEWDYSQRLFLIKTDSLGNDTLVNNILPYQTQPITKFELHCYPNPAVNEFHVDITDKTGDDVLEIYSTNGTIVHEQTVIPGESRIDICELKPGMYLVRLRNSGLFGKIVIE